MWLFHVGTASEVFGVSRPCMGAAGIAACRSGIACGAVVAGGGGFRRLDLLAPFHHARGQGTVRDDDDRAADGPPAQIGSIVRAQHHHCAFSSPTSATLRYPAARRRFMTCITSP